MIKRLLQTDSSKATLLIRLMTGTVFLSEGIQKFLYPAMRGAGRFEAMGFPNPEFFASFVGIFEIVSGVFLLVGLVTRGAALAMFINMSVALLITKIPILFGHGFWIFNVRELPFYNFWSFAHEVRTDWAMWLGSLFLLIKGGGRWSVDRWILCRFKRHEEL